MTKDADLATHGVPNDADTIRRVVAQICTLQPDPHDGIVIDPASIRTEIMREGGEYHGVRCKLVANLAQARISFALDFSFGDPGISTRIELDSVVDRPSVSLQAYPLALNLAEKLVTVMQRRETSTRDRDFADVWVASRRHLIAAAELRRNVMVVANHRQQPIIPMAEALRNMPDRQREYAAMVERMSYLSPPPKLWPDLLDGVIRFADPLLLDADGSLKSWDPERLEWAIRD